MKNLALVPWPTVLFSGGLVEWRAWKPVMEAGRCGTEVGSLEWNLGMELDVPERNGPRRDPWHDRWNGLERKSLRFAKLLFAANLTCHKFRGLPRVVRVPDSAS